MTGGSILLVEDSADDVALTLRALRKNNIHNKVIVATDGEEALDALAPGGAEEHLPDLVLLDINLPRLNGLEVLRAIRHDERTRFLPVVVLTTSTEDRDIMDSYQLGANSYIRKPVVFEQFLEAVRVLGSYWLLINQSVIDLPADRYGRQ